MPRTLVAQVCTGLPSLGTRQGSVTANADFSDGVQQYSGALAVGSASGLFGGAAVGVTSYNGLEGNTVLVSPTVGLELAPSPRSAVRVCPIVGAEFGFGPNNIAGMGIDMTSRDVNGGLALGTSLPASPSIDVIPAVAASYHYATVKLSADGYSESTSDDFGLLQFAVGLSFQRSVTLRPSVSVPVGIEGAKAQFGVSLGFRFGGQTSSGIGGR